MSVTVLKWLTRWIPGIPELFSYKRALFKGDFVAALSLAAVALPTGIAYAQLVGMPPQAGIFSTIFPMIVYSFFGSSRQLIIGPDAGTCAMFAAALAPLVATASDPAYYQELAMTMTLLTGVLFLVACKLRLGFLADLQSRPILIGLINGVAIMIIVGQLGNITGISQAGKNTFIELYSFLSFLSTIHWVTAIFSLCMFVLFYSMQRLFKKVPPILIVAIVAIISCMVFSLHEKNLQIVGVLPSAIPSLTMPAIPTEQLGNLLLGATALALVSFFGASLPAHTFAAKNNYEIDDNQELFALGVSNIASGMAQGFVISGASSRTAVNDASGGKTRFAQLFSALIILLVLFLFIKPIGYMPLAALGVILICSSIKMMSLRTLWQLRHYSQTEFYIALFTLFSVLLFGVIYAVLFSIFLAVLSFLRKTARPVDHRLGLLPHSERFYELAYHADAKEVEGMLIYRFDASLIFLNANYFRQRILAFINEDQENGIPIRWVVVDGSSINNVDITGLMVLSQLGEMLSARNIVLAYVDKGNHLEERIRRYKISSQSFNMKIFERSYEVLAAYREATSVNENASQPSDNDKKAE